MKKEKWNVAVSNYFRAIANLCDFKIYTKIRILPKNHNERFELLKKNFPELHNNLLKLFKTYRNSYNQRLTKEDATSVQIFANELRNTKNKE